MIQIARLCPYGNIAEAGCYKGLSSYLISNYLNYCQFDIFDSFKGLSMPSDKDRIPKSKKGQFKSSVDNLKWVLKEADNISVHKGWIPEVFEQSDTEKYSFVHIDVDLYHPTKQSLEYFYPRMVDHGIIIIDDFGPWPKGGNFPGCTKAVMEFCSNDYSMKFAALECGNAMITK